MIPFAFGTALAQVATNAYDVASNYGSFTGNQGFGFGGWTVNTTGGGKYISGDIPPYFGIWNSAANSVSTAIRPFYSVLAVGQTFSLQLMMNSLDAANNTNGIKLQDAGGKVLFSYWHQGGDTANGHYTDAGITNGTAMGFAMDQGQMDSFAFFLTGPTNYTFSDLSTGTSISGTLLEANIAQVTFFRANGNNVPTNGQDFKFNTLAFTYPIPTNAATDRAWAAMDAYNTAFLVQTNGQSFYKKSVTTNLYAGTWVQGLEIQGAEDAYDRTKSVIYKQLVNNLTITFLAKENYNWSQDTWNDDIAWMTIACIRGYQITGNSNLLNQATNAWNMAYNRGWDSALGGGIWEEMNSKDAKCALSNDPMIIVGTALYQATGQSAYLAKCQNIYTWVRNNLFNPTNGQIYESIRSNGVVGVSDNPYNSGAFINAANCLYKITGDTNYFYDALLAASHVVNNRNILYDNGRGDSTWADQFVRGLSYFARDNNLRGLYNGWMVSNANAAWSVRRPDLNITWNNWIRPTAMDSCSSLECLSASVIQQLVPDTNSAPVFTLQPSNSVSAIGNAVILTSLATNGQPVVYQWYHGTGPVLGATGANLVLPSVGLADAGIYWVVASNSAADACSQTANVYLIGNTNGVLAQDSATNYNPIVGFSGNQGFGFGPWVLSTVGGGCYINSSPALFAIWNGTSNSQSTASRDFTMPLPVGASFWLQLQMNYLESANTNGFSLQDAAGNVLFSYWHQGGDNSNGHYADANGSNTAVGFAYDYGMVDTLKLTLNTPTDYIFADLTTGRSFSGKLSGAPISKVVFFRLNDSVTPANGEDFKFSNLAVTTTPVTPIPAPITGGFVPQQGWSLYFPAAPGYPYRVQRATQVAGPWTDMNILIGPITGTAESIDTNPLALQAFYRTVTP